MKMMGQSVPRVSNGVLLGSEQGIPTWGSIRRCHVDIVFGGKLGHSLKSRLLKQMSLIVGFLLHILLLGLNLAVHVYAVGMVQGCLVVVAVMVTHEGQGSLLGQLGVGVVRGTPHPVVYVNRADVTQVLAAHIHCVRSTVKLMIVIT